LIAAGGVPRLPEERFSADINVAVAGSCTQVRGVDGCIWNEGTGRTLLVVDVEIVKSGRANSHNAIFWVRAVANVATGY
jgi:hypothetical protein